MKKSMIVVVIVLTLFIFLTQTYSIMASRKTEEQKYKVVHSEKDFEIRFYPATTIATVYSSVHSYRELSGSGFRKLAGYIFGGNESDTQIAMTAPVHMDINDSVSSMSFVMPSGYTQENLPKPKDAKINIQKTSDEYVAAIRFGGFASDKDIERYSEKLKKLLDEKNIRYTGNFRYLGYNPPFQLIGRRNEIIVTVDWSEK
ncbi:MAG: heme-binding protein [Sphingobacteriales bacterium]|nr:heme-binding protein [Sphingobacteriales bacterium]